MYVVFYGTDRGAAHDAMSAHIEAHMPPDGTLSVIEAGDYVAGQLADALGAHSLFGGSQWYVFDTPSENEEFETELRESLSALAESSNTFLILEGALLAEPKKRYAKYAAEMCEHKAPGAQKFNVFSLTDALAVKDKRRLWTLLMEARLSGSSNEAIVGILWWQLKTMRLAMVTKTAAEAGMKEFPYNKAKRALSKFRGGELNRLSHSLLALYHDAHAGVRDLDLALERWVLEM